MNCFKCSGNNISESDFLSCSVCKLNFHFVCQLISEKNFRKMSTENKTKWKCIQCKSGNVVDKKNNMPSNEGNIMTTMSGAGGEGVITTATTGGKGILSPADLESIALIVKNMLHKEMPVNFKNEFNELKESIVFISREFDSFKNELLEYKKEMKDLKSEILNLKSENNNLKYELANLQNYSRKDNLIVSGIAETPNETPNGIFEVLSKAIKSPLTSRDISVAHRLPSTVKGGVKPVVIKFLRRQDKQSWLADFRRVAAEDDSGPGLSSRIVAKNLPESRVFVNEHLAPYLQSLHKKARKMANDKGYQFTWVRDGKILVKKDELTKKICVIKRDEDLFKL